MPGVTNGDDAARSEASEGRMSDFHFYEPRLGHGLPHDPFKAIVAPRVADAPAALECKLLMVVPLKDLEGRATANTLILGQVVGVHIDRAFLKEGMFDMVAAGTIARCGYLGDYARVTGLFEMRRP